MSLLVKLTALGAVALTLLGCKKEMTSAECAARADGIASQIELSAAYGMRVEVPASIQLPQRPATERFLEISPTLFLLGDLVALEDEPIALEDAPTIVRDALEKGFATTQAKRKETGSTFPLQKILNVGADGGASSAKLYDVLKPTMEAGWKIRLITTTPEQLDFDYIPKPDESALRVLRMAPAIQPSIGPVAIAAAEGCSDVTEALEEVFADRGWPSWKDLSHVARTGLPACACRAKDLNTLGWALLAGTGSFSTVGLKQGNLQLLPRGFWVPISQSVLADHAGRDATIATLAAQ